MRIFLVALLVLLTGCAQIQAKFDTQVQAASVPDLQAAISDAKAANDQDGVDCWTQVLGYVQSLPTASASSPTPSVVGVASALEAARTVAEQPVPSFPPIPAALHKACAVLVVDAQQLAVKLGISAAALRSGAILSADAAKLKAAAAALPK